MVKAKGGAERKGKSGTMGTQKKKHQHNKHSSKSPKPQKKKIQKPEKQLKKKSGNGQIENIKKKVAKIQEAEFTTPLDCLIQHFQSANNIQLSSLELQSFKPEACILDLPQGLPQDASSLIEPIKTAFGPSWREVLFEKKLPEENIESGNPALLLVSLSALRSLELLRGLRPLTVECQAAKLFSKHMKIEDQVSVLKNRVNIASGTPSRIKKLIDMEALGLSRLSVILLDMHTDVKGYSLFTLPQVRDEFWELYKTYFHPRVLQGDIRICLYGPLPRLPKNRTNH